MAKIDVLTSKLIVHVPVDPGDPESVHTAAIDIEHLHIVAKGIGQTTIETRLNRVAAPEPEPKASDPVVPEAPDAEPPDDLDIPDNLRRTTEPDAAG